MIVSNKILTEPLDSSYDGHIGIADDTKLKYSALLSWCSYTLNPTNGS
jgi:hypothetical protein